MPSFSKCLAEEGAAFMGLKIVENGVFQENILTNLLCNQPKEANALITGTRNLADNLSDFKA
jgi:5-oxoprolinase (ATP-hydrolysing)